MMNPSTRGKVAVLLSAMAVLACEGPRHRPERLVVPIADEPSLGAADARVTVVLWGDLSSPRTAGTYQALRLLAQDPANDLRLVWKNLPASETGMIFARSAMAAHELGLFWAYADAAAEVALAATGGEQPGELTDPIASVVEEQEAYEGAIAGGLPDERLQRDLAQAVRFGVRRTPTLVVNGRVVPGAPAELALSRIVKEEAQLADQLLAGGVPRAQITRELAARAPGGGDGLIRAMRALATARRERVDTEGALALGPNEAAIELVVVGDYACGACKEAFEMARALTAASPARIRLLWLNRANPEEAQSRLAAGAVLAAARQGRLAEMHEALLSHRGTLEREQVLAYARDLGLDVRAFEAALDDAELQARALRGGAQRGALPAFVVGGWRLDGMVPDQALRALVQVELARVAAPRLAARE